MSADVACKAKTMQKNEYMKNIKNSLSALFDVMTRCIMNLVSLAVNYTK